MESLVTELVWLVTNYQAWVVGVLLFVDPHVWYRRYSFFEILALCKDAGTAPATRRKKFLVFEFLMQHLLWLKRTFRRAGWWFDPSIYPSPACNLLRETEL